MPKQLSEKYFKIILENLSSPVLIIDQNGLIQFVNLQVESFFGYTQSALVGQPVERLISKKMRKKYIKLRKCYMLNPLIYPKGAQMKILGRHYNGQSLKLDIELSPFQTEEGEWLVAILIHDIRLEDALDQVDYLKHHDLLTGLENFTSIRHRLENLIQSGHCLSVSGFLIGLDNFKLLNNLIGLQNCDLILKKTAILIEKHIDGSDFLARKSADEFFLVSCNADRKKTEDKARAILSLLNRPFFVSDQKIQMTASIGMSCYPEDAGNADELLNHVDIALHYAKKTGKNNYQLFTKAIGQNTNYLHHLQTDLTYALERKEFVIHYQIQMDVSARRIVGVEALLRWQHPTYGLILPYQFIPIAEKMGKMYAIGAWVLREACIQAKAWQKAGHTFQVAVNLSINQLMNKRGTPHDAFVDLVKNILKETELSPDLLILEITENIFLKTHDPIIKLVNQLKKIGVQIACDDFGSGYASFLRIEQLPLDQVKIDRSLIDEITTNEVQHIVMHRIVSMIEELGMKIVVEGVETESQCALLQGIGCQVIQGHYIDVPKPPCELDFSLISFTKR